MTISDFSLKIILLFLPGIVSFLIIDNLAAHRQTKTIHWFMYPMLLGFLSYAFLEFVFPDIRFWHFLTEQAPGIDYYEIIRAIFIGIVLGCLLTYIINHALLFKAASFFRLTNRQGLPDTFSYMLSLYPVQYLTVTDWEKRIRIVGELVATSESSDNRDEIILQNATIYSLDTGDNLYDIPVIYLAQDFNKITIEISDTSSKGDDQYEKFTTSH